jgi:hypothetical protein
MQIQMKSVYSGREERGGSERGRERKEERYTERARKEARDKERESESESEKLPGEKETWYSVTPFSACSSYGPSCFIVSGSEISVDNITVLPSQLPFKSGN